MSSAIDRLRAAIDRLEAQRFTCTDRRCVHEMNNVLTLVSLLMESVTLDEEVGAEIEPALAWVDRVLSSAPLARA